MKSHLSVFVLTAILIASIGMTPAFAQIQSAIVVTTDNPSYGNGATVLVTGEVKDKLSGVQVSMIVKAPNGNRVNIDQIAVNDDKTFNTDFKAGGNLMKATGTYTITTQYGDKNRTAETTFEYTGGDVVITPPVTGEVTNPYLVDGSSEGIPFTITGGELLSIEPNVAGNSLIIKIDATEDGSLTLTIPRSILESVDENGDDKDVFILVDAEESVDATVDATATSRVITIPFPAGATEIEIVGTFVIPEFGTIAAMILAVAIISIIAISARSKLSIMPRY